MFPIRLLHACSRSGFLPNTFSHGIRSRIVDVARQRFSLANAGAQSLATVGLKKDQYSSGRKISSNGLRQSSFLTAALILVGVYVLEKARSPERFQAKMNQIQITSETTIESFSFEWKYLLTELEKNRASCSSLTEVLELHDQFAKVEARYLCDCLKHQKLDLIELILDTRQGSYLDKAELGRLLKISRKEIPPNLLMQAQRKAYYQGAAYAIGDSGDPEEPWIPSEFKPWPTDPENVRCYGFYKVLLEEEIR